MRQLDSGAYTTQHQTSTAHVTAADEFLRKQQPLTEDGDHRFQVLRCRHASKKNEIAGFARGFVEKTAISFQWEAVARIRDIDRNRCNLVKIF
jgi:hypothetical protein